MAASSKRVLQALEEMRDVVGAAKPPRTTRRSRVGEEGMSYQRQDRLSTLMIAWSRQPYTGPTIIICASQTSTRRPRTLVEVHGAANVLESCLAFLNG